ncbi:MAG: DUF1830 domain-containing protein [Cyanobacteria bacterium P01_A01_bin.137]
MKSIQENQFKPAVPKSPHQAQQPTSHIDQIQCCYSNDTTQFQIVRVVNIANTFLERAVMPHTKLVFEAAHNDHLEIHTGTPVSSILSDKIPCQHLAYQGELNR